MYLGKGEQDCEDVAKRSCPALRIKAYVLALLGTTTGVGLKILDAPLCMYTDKGVKGEYAMMAVHQLATEPK